MLEDFARPTMHLPAPSPQETLAWMARETRLGLEDVEIRLFAEQLVQELWPHDYLSEYAALLNWVRTHIRYSRDPIIIEQVKTPRAVLETKTGDCMTLDTKIIVRDRAGFYCLKTLSELRDSFNAYDALSYNFTNQIFEFKPIVAWIDKGEQPAFEVKLHNGYSAFCTLGHKFFVWSQRDGRYDIQKLEELWLGDKMRRGCGLFLAKQIPFLNHNEFWSNSEEIAWLSGSYVAEGWHEGHHVCIAKQDPNERLEITKRLDALDIPYAISKRTKSAYVSIHSHPFKEFLKSFGHRALVKHIPFEGLSASKAIIESLLKGYAWGDSWTNKDKDSRRIAMHSTVSDELAEQLKFIHLLLGRYLSGSLVIKHGGLGKNPIWRLWESSGKRPDSRKEDLRPKNLISKPIRFVESVGVRPVCDITVADNHNFVLSNGLIAHNCDDQCTLLGTLVGTLGGRARYVAGAFKLDPDGSPNFSHVWCEAFDPASKAWIVLDPVPGRNVASMLRRILSTIIVEAS